MSKCKEEGEANGLDTDATQTKTENHLHTFRFRYQYKKYTVTCNVPMTVLERLQTDFAFRAICKKNQNGVTNELVIQREQSPRAAVTPNFPCCLLNDNELLNISFVKSSKNNGTVKSPKLAVHSPECLVSFYIKTRGDKNIRMVMKNNALKNNVDDVCVYAVKGENVKAALRRDGRFNTVTLKKGCLLEEETDCRTNLTNLVDDLHGKHFQITVNPHPPDSQEMSQEMSQESETVKNDKSEVPETPQENTTTTQPSTNAPEMKPKTPQEENKSRKYPETKKIPNTEEILNLLREQHKDLLKTLKERENLKNDAEVKKFFRQEYDKSAQSFSEVKRVKQLMELSNSVCQIRIDGYPRGTGFLLFDRFVVTNAHVAGAYDHFTRRLHRKLTAVFDYEDLISTGKVIPVKENLVAVFYGKDEMDNHLDFALLELEEEEDEKELCSFVKRPALLNCYSAPPFRGGVCIIGHPADGVKQMDPCFIITKENFQQEVQRHYENNPIPQVFEAITRWSLLEDSELRKSQIFYNSCFFHGSSGSPVFDEYCKLIGVHTGGYDYEGERKKMRSVMEYSLPMFPILVRILIQCFQSGRSDVLQYFKSQNNMELVLQVADRQLQRM